MDNEFVPRGAKPLQEEFVPRGAKPLQEEFVPRGAKPYQEPERLVYREEIGKRLNALGTGALRTGARIVDALTELSPDYDPATAMRLESKLPPSSGGWDTAGGVAADVALGFVPVLKGGQVLTRTLGRIPGLSKAAPVLGDVAASSGYTAATTPGEDRGEAALYGAAGAAGGRVLNKALGQPIKPTATAQEMMDQGLHLTPGMANKGVAGTILRNVEGTLEQVPLVSSPLRHAKEKLAKDLENIGEHSSSMERALLEAREAKVTPEALAAERKALARRTGTAGAVTTGTAAALAWYLAHPALPMTAAMTSYIGAHPTGAKVLMGQYPMQKFLQENPVIATTLGRVIANQQQGTRDE